jgi:hypothetical protein
MIAYQSGNCSVRTIPFGLVLGNNSGFSDKLWQTEPIFGVSATQLDLTRTSPHYSEAICIKHERDVLRFQHRRAAQVIRSCGGCGRRMVETSIRRPANYRSTMLPDRVNFALPGASVGPCWRSKTWRMFCEAYDRDGARPYSIGHAGCLNHP